MIEYYNSNPEILKKRKECFCSMMTDQVLADKVWRVSYNAGYVLDLEDIEKYEHKN